MSEEKKEIKELELDKITADVQSEFIGTKGEEE